MKFIAMFLALAMYAFAMAQSQTDLTCEFNCDPQEIAPICGVDYNGTRKTFSNMCIMKQHNCIKKTSYLKTSEGECP